MDWHAFDIGRCRRADIEHGPTFIPVVCAPTLRRAIGVVQVDHDVGRVKQHNHVLRQVAQRVDPEFDFGQANRPGFGGVRRLESPGAVWRALFARGINALLNEDGSLGACSTTGMIQAEPPPSTNPLPARGPC
jgi:hypothetical protein